MKPKNIILTPTQKLLFDAYQPMIDKAVETEINRVLVMSKGAAEYCTTKAQEFLNAFPNPIEKIGRAQVNNKIADFCLLYRYKKDKLKIQYRSTLDRTFDKSFTASHVVDNIYGSKGVILTDENKSDYKLIFSKELFDKAIVEYEKEYRQFMAGKLERSITKYVTENYIKVSRIEITRGNEGWEVRCILKNKAACNFSMYTKAINAGGHNIQCFHYRYITKIK